MIGISIAARLEWEATLNKFNISIDNCKKYPFGEYFITKIGDKDVILYRCGVRKMNSSAATQYMIDHFNLEKVIVAGTCAGIDDNYKPLDIFIPNLAVQYDCTVKETEGLIKESFNIQYDTNNISDRINTGIIGTADKPVVMWKDYLELKENGITIADTEAAAIAYICKANKIESVIIKGISDFPVNEQISSKEETHEEQLNTFIKNIPIVMSNIFDNYLETALNKSVYYADNMKHKNMK